MSAAGLSVRDLRVVFATAGGRIFAVDGVDLDVGPGEVVGLVGESGSGKSVSLRAIARLLHAHATITGSVRWRGQELLGLSEAQMRPIRGGQIGIIFQEPMAALNPVLPIGLQIDESLMAHTTLDRGARRARALELLDQVGIASGATRLGQFAHEFSGGMRQRAMIAIALAAAPALLLADEPTTALDVTIQDQILRLLLRLKDELGMALLLVTHDLGVVAETCTKVAVMYAGRVCETGPTADVFARPQHAYTAALLRAMPGTGPAQARLVPIPGMAPRLDAPSPGCAFAPRCTVSEDICATTRPPLVADGVRSSACYARGRL